MTLFKAALLSVCLCLPTAGYSGVKVYSGSEAQAIRCSQLMLFAAEVGREGGFLTRRQSEGIKAYGLHVLMKYTSGTTKQKGKAVVQMMKGTNPFQSQAKFLKQHKTCLRQFP